MTRAVPILYLVAILGLALFTAIKPCSGRWITQGARGILEGALLSYAFTTFTYFSTETSQRTDGTFRWGTLYVGLLLTGPLFCSVGAAVHLLIKAVRLRLKP